MRRSLRFAFVIAMCCLGTGCRLFDNAWRTSVVEPLQYSRDAYEKIARRRFLGLAEQALEQAITDARAESDNYYSQPYSLDYQCGFCDGFVDYLEAGGTGVPQPLPPRRYWKSKYQNPAGFQRMEDWVGGFQHGAAAARASNYRSFVVVPLTDDVSMSTEPYGYGRITRQEDVDAEDQPGDPRVAEAGSRDNGPRPTEVPSLTRLPPVADAD